MSTTASYKKMITKGYASAIDNTPIENDTIRMTIDTFQLFADLNDERIEITDFIKGMTEEEIRSIYAPLPKFYFALDTHKLLVYDSNVDEWVVCAERNTDKIAKALEADHAISADSATSAINATNASTAEYASVAENASTAQYANAAESANTATNANHATTADTATNASTADYASTAENASTAQYANNANVANSATNASTAEYANSADTANTATNASTAEYAVNANIANTATNASTAEYATNADKANTANSAESANTATHATSADSAANASTAEYASNAENASTAQYANAAESANTATNASTAEYATNADKANSATNASTSEYANNAENASTAQYAVNASTADYSSYSNKSLQDANGQQINTHYAPLQSPMFTGIPTVPTPASGSNDSQIANTQFVINAILENMGSAGSGVVLLKVDSFEDLPEVGTSGVIYLVPNSSGEDKNYYDEYIWINDSYEIIGTTKIDLSGYYNSIEVTGTGNAVTGVLETENGLQFVKNASFLTEHPSVTKTSSAVIEAPSGGSIINMVDSVAVDAYGHLVNYRLKTVTLPDSVSNAGTATYANSAETAVNASTATYATNAGTATYGTNAGTASYATNAGSATNATNASTATYANSAETAINASTATYAVNAGNATNASTATYATNAGTATYGTNAGTAVYATNAGTATRATSDSDGNNINTTYIKNVTVDGKVVTFEKGNGSTFSINTQDTDTTYSNYVGATTAAAGKPGLVPSASTAARAQFLRGDGAWATPANTTYNVVSTNADGLCPKRNGSTYSFFRGDGSWASVNVSPEGESDLDFGDLDE